MENKVVFLGIISNFRIPALISFVCIFFFGLPVIAFCDPGDGDGGDTTRTEEATGARPQDEVASTSAAGPSSRVESINLNQFPNLRERGRNLMGELEEIGKVVDQLHAQASSIHSEAELRAWTRKPQELEEWFARTERALSEAVTQDRERVKEREIEAAALRPDPAEVAGLEQRRRLWADLHLQVRVDPIARDQYERDRARARGF